MMTAQISVGSLIFAVFLAASDAHSENVIKFKVEKEGKSLLEIMRHPMFKAPIQKSTLGTYKYINCGTRADLMNVTLLTATPDPIRLPGTLGVNFAGEFKAELQAPLKIDLVLERRVGSAWIKIPCIGGIGSCTYDDICETLSGAECPDPFVDNDVPCKCPFLKGSYKLPNVSFYLDTFFPPGDYRAIGKIVSGYNETPTGCIELYASFA